MCFKYLFNCKYTAFENVNPNNLFFKITIYTIVNIYYNNLYAALDRFTETCNHNYTKIWTNTSYFIHIFLQYFKQIPYERIKLTGTQVIN